jgi:ribonuclease T1
MLPAAWPNFKGMMRRLVWIVLCCISAQLVAPLLSAQARQRSAGSVDLVELPKEARQTIALIKQGGPFPYKKDGTVFGNFERRLPIHERGYYKEFTVRSPGARDRGARRIIVGKAGELYYTDDHYETFRRVRE